MKRLSVLILLLYMFSFIEFIPANDEVKQKMDEFTFGTDKLWISFYGHSSLMLDYNGLLIYVDPVSQYANYQMLPKADIILVTHEHGDHLDASAVERIEKRETEIISNQNCVNILRKGKAIKNWQSIEIKRIKIEGVPAYNTTKGREQFHPKGRDNGFILTLGTTKLYIAGDTEDIPEMSNFKNIEIAFLPVNQPYTMNLEQITNAAKMLKPKVLYPYHLGNTDIAKLESVLKEYKDIDVRIRDMK